MIENLDLKMVNDLFKLTSWLMGLEPWPLLPLPERHLHTVQPNIKAAPPNPHHNQLVRLALPSHGEILWTKSACHQAQQHNLTSSLKPRSSEARILPASWEGEVMCNFKHLEVEGYTCQLPCTPVRLSHKLGLWRFPQLCLLPGVNLPFLTMLFIALG